MAPPAKRAKRGKGTEGWLVGGVLMSDYLSYRPEITWF